MPVNRKVVTGLAAIALFASAQIPTAAAGPAWDEIRASVFGDKAIADGHGVLTLDAPGRPEDMRVVPIAVKAGFNDGRTVKAVTFLIDENPTPVVADFKIGPGRSSVALNVNFRVDRQSDVRAVVEASDGQLYMVTRLVKYAGGQSSCSAPPTGDPLEIAANMGKMALTPVADAEAVATSNATAKAQLVLRHPNHTGMVMDQQTLLYTPMKMVSEVAVRQGGELVFTAVGSIALSQDPSLIFDYDKGGATEMTVTFKDTDGGEWSRSFPVGPQS
ncbi:MAG: quinoprotein dehydrogenase-associated SoxYZ-like carrier [Hyphomicrobium sp.]